MNSITIKKKQIPFIEHIPRSPKNKTRKVQTSLGTVRATLDVAYNGNQRKCAHYIGKF